LTSTSASNGTRNWYLYWYRCISSVDVFITKHRGSQPRPRFRCGSTADTNGRPVPNGCPLGRRGLRRPRRPSMRGVMATQVPVAPAGKIRWDIKPVGVPAGVRHRHHSSRWKHCCDGNVFSCRPVWACPNLAHEPRPRVNLHLGRALHGLLRTSPAPTSSMAWRPT
jgi:hypothetical protein